MFAYRDAWDGAGTAPGSKLFGSSGVKNRRTSGTETSNSATKAMFSSASGQVRSTLSPRCIAVLDFGIPLSETNDE
jgi:hypothetical protein